MAGVVSIFLEATIPSVSAPHTKERCNTVPDLSPRIIASIFSQLNCIPNLGRRTKNHSRLMSEGKFVVDGLLFQYARCHGQIRGSRLRMLDLQLLFLQK